MSRETFGMPERTITVRKRARNAKAVRDDVDRRWQATCSCSRMPTVRLATPTAARAAGRAHLAMLDNPGTRP